MSEPAAEIPFDPRPNVLYRMFDAARQLLYVGITCNPGARLGEHRDEKEWWSQVATIALEHFENRADLETAERLAIRTERPRFNVMHVLRPPREDGHGSRRTTPPRSTQIDDSPWERFGEVAAELGTSRAALMRELVLWFIRWPGAKLPKRPDRAP